MRSSIYLYIVAITAVPSATSFASYVQDTFANLSFSEGKPGDLIPARAFAAPPGWHLGPESTPAYVAQIDSGAACHTGPQCAMVRSVGSGAHTLCFLYQILDAKPYRGKLIRFRAAVRSDVAGGDAARLLVRVHRQDGSTSFRDDMGNHPITSAQWAYYEIDAPIVIDAGDIELGMQLVGSGAAWIDNISIEFADPPANPPQRN